MTIDYGQIDFLKIYLCKTKSATIHNLNVAQGYFSQTSDVHIISQLIATVSSMSDSDFERWYNRITTAPYE